MPTKSETAELLEGHRESVRMGSFQLAEMAVLGSVLLATTGHLMIKAGLIVAARVITLQASTLSRLVHYFSQPWVLLGLAIYGIGTALWVFAVSKRDISHVFPITALNYVLIILGGKFLFSEIIPLRRWLGVAVVIIGVAMMQSAGRKGTR